MLLLDSVKLRRTNPTLRIRGRKDQKSVWKGPLAGLASYSPRIIPRKERTPDRLHMLAQCNGPSDVLSDGPPSQRAPPMSPAKGPMICPQWPPKSSLKWPQLFKIWEGSLISQFQSIILNPDTGMTQIVCCVSEFPSQNARRARYTNCHKLSTFLHNCQHCQNDP